MPHPGRSGRIKLTRRRWLGQAAALGGWAWATGRPTIGRASGDEVADGNELGGLFVQTGRQNPGPLRGLFAVDPESFQWRRVLEDGNITARVSPDRRSIAFGKLNEAGRFDGLWIADLGDDREPRRLSERFGRLCWGPDSKSLIVSGLIERNGNTFETWRVPRDGSAKSRIALPDDEQVIDLSPDGQWLLTVATLVLTEPGKRARTNRVYVRRIDGGNPQPLTEGTEYTTHRFAPDGQRVVYSRNDGERQVHSLWMVGRDGKDDHCLIKGTDDQSAFFACWSPDGKRLAVDVLDPEKDDKGKFAGFERHIEILELASGQRRDLNLPFAEAIPVDWR